MGHFLYLLENLARHLANAWGKYNRNASFICFRNSLFVVQSYFHQRPNSTDRIRTHGLLIQGPWAANCATRDKGGLSSILSTHLQESARMVVDNHSSGVYGLLLIFNRHDKVDATRLTVPR